ncbi:MAG: hypothetical protein HC821_04940 [Lewinella sp.]|nr:hypothetical protein [Lewinella sp.]
MAMLRIVVFLLCWSVAVSAFAQGLMPLSGGEGSASTTSGWESQQNWTTAQDLEGRFSISIPAPAWSQRVDSVPTPLGTLAYHSFYYQPPFEESAENAVYSLSYVDYPEFSLHQDSSELVQEFLLATREAAVERMKGELRFAAERILQFKYPGSYWRIDYLQGQASVRTQAFVVGRRYYALQTISTAEGGLNHSTDRFFDSFAVFSPPK